MPILHDFQKEAITSLTKAFQSKKRLLLALPTGSGKTVVVAKFIKEECYDKGLNVLWIAHREELLIQAGKALTAAGIPGWAIGNHFGNNLYIDYARNKIYLYNNNIDLNDNNDRKRWPSRDAIKFIVIDEAHRAIASTYRGILKYYMVDKNNGPMLLGMTATPFRSEDGCLIRLDHYDFGGKIHYPQPAKPIFEDCAHKAYKPIFEDCAYARSQVNIIKDGVCAPFLLIKCPKEDNKTYELEWDNRRGDYKYESVDTLNNPNRNQALVSFWKENKNAFGKTLVFAVNKDHAEKLAREFKNQGVSAGYVTGDSGDRKDVIQDFRAGRISVLVNVEIFTEGVDIPDIKTVMLARPTASKAKYLQMVGRGSRTTPRKKYYYILDIDDNVRYLKSGHERVTMEGLIPDKAILEWVQQKSNYYRMIEDSPLGILMGDKSILTKAIKMNGFGEYYAIIKIESIEGIKPLLVTKEEYDNIRKNYPDSIENKYHMESIIDNDSLKTNSMCKLYSYLHEGCRGEMIRIEDCFINQFNDFVGLVSKVYKFDIEKINKLHEFYTALERFVIDKYGARGFPASEIAELNNDWFEDKRYNGVLYMVDNQKKQFITIGPKTYNIMSGYFNPVSDLYHNSTVVKEKLLEVHYWPTLANSVSNTLLNARTIDDIFIAFDKDNQICSEQSDAQ